MVNESFVTLLFPQGRPLLAKIKWGAEPLTIVGVMAIRS